MRKYGFDIYVVEDACRGVDANGSLAAAWLSMQKVRVKWTRSTQVASA
jgi:nicotinamidase/pyrazinamidase